jgi:hypothetical protein
MDSIAAGAKQSFTYSWADRQPASGFLPKLRTVLSEALVRGATAERWSSGLKVKDCKDIMVDTATEPRQKQFPLRFAHVLTTNDPAQLDAFPALLRPGRLDLDLRFPLKSRGDDSNDSNVEHSDFEWPKDEVLHVDEDHHVARLPREKDIEIAGPPTILRLTVPRDFYRCAGLYRIVKWRIINGFPLWQMDDGERWIFSSSELGAWSIGGPDEESADFASEEALITSDKPHHGSMPDKVVRWFTGDVELENLMPSIIPGMTVISEDMHDDHHVARLHREKDIRTDCNDDLLHSSHAPPAVLRLTVPRDPYCCAGLYHIVKGRIVNGYPLWRMDDGERWIFSSPEVGAWSIAGPDEESVDWFGGPDEASADFASEEALITSDKPHHGSMPDEVVRWFSGDMDLENLMPSIISGMTVISEDMLTAKSSDGNSLVQEFDSVELDIGKGENAGLHRLLRRIDVENETAPLSASQQQAFAPLPACEK